MFHDGGYMVGMHLGWWLFWLILIGVLFTSLRSGSARRQHAGRKGQSAVLQRRLAAGEITAQQYEALKALLDRDAPHATALDFPTVGRSTLVLR